MAWRPVRSGIALLLALFASNAAVVHAAPSVSPQAQVVVVTKPDGGVVVRLVLPARARNVAVPATMRPKLPAVKELAEGAEPRAMTALATIVKMPPAATKTLSRQRDSSAKRRLWVDAIEPELFMQWRYGGVDAGFAPAAFKHM